MKTLIVAAIALLVAAQTWAQVAPATGQEAATPFKGANVILIHAPDSAAVALKKLARALVVAGIEPDKLDAEVGYLTTKDKPVGQMSPANFVYRAVASPEAGGTLLTLTGTYSVRLNAVRNLTESMFWAKGNLTQGKQCFALIQPVAVSYPGGRVGYGQRKL